MVSLFSESQRAREKRVYYGGIFLLVLSVVLFALPPSLFEKLGILFAGVVLWIVFLLNIEWGVYALAATTFFSGWYVYLSTYSWFQNNAFLSSLSAPLADFVATVLLISLSVAVLCDIIKIPFNKLKKLKPIIYLYGFFIAVATIAAYLAVARHIGPAYKYLIRSMVFVFPAFVLSPVILLPSRQRIEGVLKLWCWLGVVVSVFGLSSLIFAPQSGWLRVRPYAVVGQFAPFGYNHNLIAEVLVALIPAGAYLAYKAFKEKKGSLRAYLCATGIMIFVTLLTLSRAGWLALATEMLVAGYFFWREFKHHIENNKNVIMVLLAVAGAVLFVYMGIFLRSTTVSDSNLARLQMADIMFFYVRESPWWGYGPGMHITIFENTRAYLLEYGEVLDAHGFMQKILLEEGIFGLATFLIFIGYVLWFLWKHILHAKEELKPLHVLGFATVAAMLVFQLFNTSYFTGVLWLPIGVSLAIALLDEKNYEHR